MSESAEPLTEEFTRDLLRSMHAIIAVVDPETWHPVAESSRFFELFPPDPADPDGPVIARIPGVDADRAADRIARGRPYKLDVEVSSGPRTISLALSFHAAQLSGRDVAIVEASDVTKAKETEYMLDSYSRMAEKNARELQRGRSGPRSCCSTSCRARCSRR